MTLDSADLRMAFVAAKFYLDGHTVKHKTPDLAVYRLLHRLEQLLLSVDGHDSVGLQPDWWTVKQLAKHTGRSERQARRTAQRVGIKVGRQWLVDPDAVESNE